MLTQATTPQGACVTAVKSVSFKYAASQELYSLFEDFRCMCNDAIRIAERERPKNKFELIGLAYARLKEYGLHTHYILSACEVAYSVHRNKKRKSVPYVRKAFLKLDNQSYKLDHLLLRIPTTSRRFVFLTLEGSDYHHLSLIDDPCLKRGSVTITERSVNIALSKEIQPFKAIGFMGIDINEKNVTVSTTDGHSNQFRELGEVVEIKERYREIRAKIAATMRGDRRKAKELLARYGRREKNRTTQRLHRVTKQLVGYARKHRLGIKIERLRGIRKLYRKGNGQGASFRGRMNTWVFGETQMQIDYKSRWDGVPIHFVNPRDTSSHCPDCGSRVASLAERKLYCLACDNTWDRDDLASKNIMACAVPQARPSRGGSEEERGDDGSDPLSGWREGRVRS